MSSRDLALAVLLRVEEGAYSNVLLPKMLRESALDARDRAFATDLVYGTLRQRRAVDHLLGLVTDRPLAELDTPTLAVLRLGAYQLTRGMPAHAAVSETVDAAPRRARGYVNAVLRKVAGLGPPWPWPKGDDVAALATRLSYPDWLVGEMIDRYGIDAARASLERGNEPPTVALRVNRRVTDADAVGGELRATGVDVTRGELSEGALRVRGTGDPARLAAVAEGRATPQDEASQAVVDILDPQPDETIVDTAAAPGGKATAIGERLGESGRVVAGDVRPGRIRFVVAALRRLRLGEVMPVVADGRAVPLRPASADRVLVDAPCSGLGVLRRRAELRWRIEREHVERAVELQRDLLRAAAETVRPGGILLYSVCTLTAAETTGIDAWAEQALPKLVADTPLGPPWRPRGRGALVLPHDADTDGMYVLRLRHT